MSKPLRITLIIAGTLIGLLLCAVGALLFLDLDALKPRVQTMASEALGMDVDINGGIGIGFPDLSLTLGDVQIRNRGVAVADAKEVHLNADLIALFRKDVQVRAVHIKRANLFVERAADGTLNVKTDKRGADRAPTTSSLAKVSVSDLTLHYSDKTSDTEINANHCNIDGNNLSIVSGKNAEPLKTLSLAAKVSCADVQIKNVVLSDVKFSAAAKNGIFDFDPIIMRLFDGEALARVRADFSKTVPAFNVHYALAKFHIDEFLSLVTPDKVVQGVMDFSLDVTTEGSTLAQMKQTMSGEASLRGESITFNGGNLDEELAHFESSQRFNLVDVGAFFFAGPIGLMVTKGYNFATIFAGSTGATQIQTIVSDWKIENGVAKATDVAMATRRYRIALKGDLDFANDRFNDVTVGLVDAAGCATVQQKIRGPFKAPVVERPNILAALAGPALKLLGSARDMITGRQCQAFYTGSVMLPK